jgi:aspartyl-tRNA(Asn)/glutamyl-tRNA(Gln) amidotransferase subunit B
MIDLIEAGEKIIQQTKSFDAASGKTSTAREKEDADDYRYFADPDLTPFLLTDDFIESIRKQIPALQNERIKKYTSLYHLSYYDASVLTDEKELADYFEQVITNTDNYKAAANWILGPVKYWMNERHSGIIDFPVPAKKLALLINLVEEGKVNFSAASAKIFPVLVENPAAVPAQVAADLNLLQQSDASAIEIIIDEVLARLPEKVKEFQKGKKGLMGLFVGEVMKVSNGKADPKITNHLLAEKLKSH